MKFKNLNKIINIISLNLFDFSRNFAIYENVIFVLLNYLYESKNTDYRRLRANWNGANA